MNIKILNKKYKKDNNLELKVQEPEDFYIYTKSLDDLILNSQEEMDFLLEKLKKAKYNKKLADFYSNYSFDFEDLTNI
ncbi:MAG: hypothetical protein ACTSQP_04285 [Promethearchaeota archaeon]